MNAQAGKRHRDMVLKLGGSQPELNTIIDYLGRQPNADAFFEQLSF